jgi:plastocyanin/mono/diheme cytochrome c family protein
MRLRDPAVRAALGVVGAGALAAGLVACGSGSTTSADLANGKTKFAACGSCHTLAAAGTTGRVGPNLDDSFRADRQAGWKESEIQGVVERWIKIASPLGATPRMPRNVVTGQDAIDVAAYVAHVAGTTPDSTVRPETPTSTTGYGTTPVASTGVKPPPPQAATGGPVTVDADPTGQLAFVQKTLAAKAGKVTFDFTNKAPVDHNFAIKGNGVHAGPSATINGGKTAKLTVTLKPGTYEYYCAVPGHEQAGMKGTLTVK